MTETRSTKQLNQQWPQNLLVKLSLKFSISKPNDENDFYIPRLLSTNKNRTNFVFYTFFPLYQNMAGSTNTFN